jgi:hypothetical protein
MSSATPPPGIDDIDFTDKLIARLTSSLCIDTSRVYATGMGTGGGLIHLLACSTTASSRIAAYAAVNANFFQGFSTVEGRAEVKDPTMLLWNKCRPQRMPTPFMVIHTENNTVYDYWGKETENGRKRLSVVQWLVEWAKRSVCGVAISMPEPWRYPDDVYKTVLEWGYIFEGFIENTLATKASYHCWGLEDVSLERDVELVEKREEEEANKIEEKEAEGVEKTEVETNKTKQSTNGTSEEVKKEEAVDPEKEKKAKEEELITDLRNNLILEHYFVRGYPYGWPRVSMPRPQDEEGKYTDKGIKAVAWEAMEEPKTEVETKREEVYTFLYGLNSSTPSTPRAQFDSTVRVLDWFRMFSLTDELPKPPRNAEGLAVGDPGMFDQIVMDLGNALSPENGTENEAEVREADAATGAKEGENASTDAAPEEPIEQIPQKEESKEKDEL